MQPCGTVCHGVGIEQSQIWCACMRARFDEIVESHSRRPTRWLHIPKTDLLAGHRCSLRNLPCAATIGCEICVRRLEGHRKQHVWVGSGGGKGRGGREIGERSARISKKSAREIGRCKIRVKIHPQIDAPTLIPFRQVQKVDIFPHQLALDSSSSFTTLTFRDSSTSDFETMSATNISPIVDCIEKTDSCERTWLDDIEISSVSHVVMSAFPPFKVFFYFSVAYTAFMLDSFRRNTLDADCGVRFEHRSSMSIKLGKILGAILKKRQQAGH